MERVTTTLPGNLVLEQDFILQVRRLQKQAERALVLNVQFAQMPNISGKRELLDAAQDNLHDLARQQGGELYLMTNGDGFLVLPPQPEGRELIFGAELVAAALPVGIDPGRTPVSWLQAFPMPESYIPLRERTNYYVELAKELDAITAETPEALLQASDVRGPLTAYSLSQIERLLDNLDIQKYLRTQTVWHRRTDRDWLPVYEENYVSTSELQQDNFPILELRASGRLFSELASMLDRRTLSAMLRGTDRWKGRPIGLNLSAGTVLSSTFAQFCHVVNGEMRGQVVFELHISELLHDYDAFMSALELLTREGFKVGIDGIHLRFLDYLKLSALPVSHLKISVGRDNVKLLQDKKVQEQLRALDADKLIFMHVDSAAGLDAGKTLGVSNYQGFFIDEQMQILQSQPNQQN